METTYPTDQSSSGSDASKSHPDPNHVESSMHLFAREAKLVLRWITLICGIATVLTMMTFIFWFWAIVPAIGMLLAIVLLMLAGAIERRTEQPGDPHEETADEYEARRTAADAASRDPDQVHQRRIDDAVERKSHRIAAGIVVAVAVAALIIAGIIFGPELIVLGGFILFAYMLLVAAPVWLGWIEDETEVEADRLKRTLEPSDSSSGQ